MHELQMILICDVWTQAGLEIYTFCGFVWSGDHSYGGPRRKGLKFYSRVRQISFSDGLDQS